MIEKQCVIAILNFKSPVFFSFFTWDFSNWCE